MKKILLLLFFAVPLLGQTMVQKGSGNVLSNGPIVVGNGNSITATGTGTIAATSIPSLSVNTTAPLAGGGSLASSLTLSIPAATGSVNGYLTSADWTTFNAKQTAGNYITALTGDGTAAGPGSAVLTLSTVNTNVGTFAGITVNGKGRVTAATALTTLAGYGITDGVNAASNDTNVTGSISGHTLTLGWTGTLAAGRLNSSVVQGITNDTNVTGSVSAQVLTLGWTGTLAAGRLNSNVVQSVVNDTNVTGSIATQALTLGWTGQLSVARGGTGTSTLTGVVLGNGTSAFTTATLSNLTLSGGTLSVSATYPGGSSITTVGTLTSGAIGSGFTAIANSALANSTVTVGTTSIALGSSSTTISGLTNVAGLSTITGGAGNMTITAGTGNSRTLALQTTTSGGTATTFLTGNADQSATFASGITVNSTIDAVSGSGAIYTLGGVSTTKKVFAGTGFSGNSVTSTSGTDLVLTGFGGVSLTLGNGSGTVVPTFGIGSGSGPKVSFTDPATGSSVLFQSFLAPGWASAAPGPFVLSYTRNANTNVSATRDWRVFSWGINGGSGAISGVHSALWTIEDYYWPDVNLLPQVEIYPQYTTPDGAHSIRPVMFAIPIQTSEITGTTNYYNAATHYINGADLTLFATFDSTGQTFAKGTTISTNNIAALSQKNAAGSGNEILLKLDASNRVAIGASGGTIFTGNLSWTGANGVLQASSGSISATDTITLVSSITAPSGLGLTLAAGGGGSPGTVNLNSNSIGGGTVYLDGSGTRGTGIIFRRIGTQVGYVGADGQWLGSTASNLMIGGTTNIDFYPGNSGTISGRFTSAGAFNIYTGIIDSAGATNLVLKYNGGAAITITSSAGSGGITFNGYGAGIIASNSSGVISSTTSLTSVNTITAASGSSLTLASGASNTDININPNGTGTVSMTSASTGGATVYLDGSGKGSGVIFRKNGSGVGFVGTDGQYLGGTSTNMMIGAVTNLDFYSNNSGTAAARIATTGVFSINATTEATTGGAGSVTTAGGIYATKAIVSGSATASTTFTTGSIIGAGGLGLSGAANVGTYVSAGTAALLTGTGDIAGSGWAQTGAPTGGTAAKHKIGAKVTGLTLTPLTADGIEYEAADGTKYYLVVATRP